MTHPETTAYAAQLSKRRIVRAGQCNFEGRNE